MQQNVKNRHEAMFDSFCKVVIKNEAADIRKKKRKIKNNEIALESMSERQISQISYEDQYQFYRKTYTVRGKPVEVTNEEIGEALQFVVPAFRAVLLMHYFMNLSDSEISKELKIGYSTVLYRKRKGLIKLREQMEARKND